MLQFDETCKFENGFYYFDDQGKSVLWEVALSVAEPFTPLSISEMDIVLPIPYEQGSLIIASDSYYRSDKYPLETLKEYAAYYSFSDYTVMSTCLKSFGSFGSYKSPWINPFFSLCPLEGINHSIWINPLRIHDIEYLNGELFATISSGQLILLPIQRRSFFGRIDLACLALATLRRECFYFVERGQIPVDYLTFLNSPFSRILAKRPRLQYFTVPYGKFFEHYHSALLYHSYDQLEYNILYGK